MKVILFRGFEGCLLDVRSLHVSAAQVQEQWELLCVGPCLTLSSDCDKESVNLMFLLELYQEDGRDCQIFRILEKRENSLRCLICIHLCSLVFLMFLFQQTKLEIKITS